MTKAALTIRGLEKSYGEARVLRGLDLELGAGVTLGLVGPNGVGKSTALRCVLGLVFPDAGAIEVDGVDAIADGVRARKRVGYLPGETSVYRWMRGRDFVRFGLAFHDEVDHDFVARCLERFEVPLERKLRSYSSGQKQMLALAVALGPVVPLHILDEPEKALDASKRHTLREILAEMKARGRSLLISSHHIAELEQLTDSYAFLHEGRVLDAREVEERIELLSRRVRVRTQGGQEPRGVPEGVRVTHDERDWILDVPEQLDPRAVARALLEHDVLRVECGRASLQEVYEDLYVQRGGAQQREGAAR